MGCLRTPVEINPRLERQTNNQIQEKSCLKRKSQKMMSVQFVKTIYLDKRNRQRTASKSSAVGTCNVHQN